MAQGHKDRLSAVDASFLHEERQSSHMHVGAIVILEGSPPSQEELCCHIESRLHLVPRYRQKLAFPRLEMGRPFWVDDASFNLDYHVRHTALPPPGSVEQLRRLVGRIFSQRLDRSKPLWEIWLVQGLRVGGHSDSFALVSKTHHALVDGISGVDIATVLFDLSASPGEIPGGEGDWEPAHEPSEVDLVAEGVKGIVRAPAKLAGEAVKAVQQPGRSIARAREAVEGLGEVARAGLDPAPAVPLNVPIGPHRRVFWLQSELADFKAVKNSLGGTVNDVFLTMVAGGLGRWLRTRGVDTDGLELRGLVPVSIRAQDQHHQLGNRIAAVRGPLPVYARDPVDRLRIVRASMQGVKESKQALGAEVITGLEDFAPPTLLAMASRLNFSTRLFNLIVTNVPGPQFPLYLMGREMQEIVPVAFLPENHALAIAAMSYNGKLDFGLLGDYDAMPDLDVLAELLEESLAELVAAARAAGQGAKEDAADARPKRVAASKPRPKGAAGGKPRPATAKAKAAPKAGSKSSAGAGRTVKAKRRAAPGGAAGGSPG